LDPAGHGSAGIVLLAEPQFDLPVKRVSRTVIMDQRQKQFVPNILVIQTGTGVDFPNSDQIEHQVYSFSPAKPSSCRCMRATNTRPLCSIAPGWW